MAKLCTEYACRNLSIFFDFLKGQTSQYGHEIEHIFSQQTLTKSTQ